MHRLSVRSEGLQDADEAVAAAIRFTNQKQHESRIASVFLSGLSSRSMKDLARYYGWDKRLTRLLSSLPRPVIDHYILESASYDKDGWRYILPRLPASAAVLCLDARFGTTAAAFAETGASVTAIHPCPITIRIMQHRLAFQNVANVNAMHVVPEAVKLPFTDGRFDAYIHHDVSGALATNPASAGSPFATITSTLLNEICRLLKPDGFAYFGVKNRYGYTDLQKMLRRPMAEKPWAAPFMSIRRVRRMVRTAGFRHSRVHPYIVERDRVCEIIPTSGYRSSKNSFLSSEKFKQIILGKLGSRFLAPAYGLVCAKGSMRPPQIRTFADDLAAQKIMSKLSENHPSFLRYCTRNGKVFVTLGKTADSDKNVIIVIPKVPCVLVWRRKEIAIVNEVRALSAFLASKLPRRYVESTSGGETYFAFNEIPGITIDRRVPHLERLTRSAVEFLIRFNQITTRKTVIRGEVYSSLVGDLIKKASHTYPQTTGIMGSIERHLRDLTIGKSVDCVWLHGDYKLENLIFNRNTFEIAGIIDWEQSRQTGLPWLDLLYLIVYNRIITEERDFFDVYREVILNGHFSDHERSFLETYGTAMPLAPEMKTVLESLFLVHHIGFRYKYDMRMERDRRNIFSALDEMEKRVVRLGR